MGLDDDLARKVLEEMGLGTAGGDVASWMQGPPVGGQMLTREQWLALERQHGGTIGVMPIDSIVKTKDYMGETIERPNPYPRYRYQFADGTYLIARTVQDRSQSKPGGQGVELGVSVTDGGTAIKFTGSTNEWEIETGPDGKKYWRKKGSRDVSPAPEFGSKPGKTPEETAEDIARAALYRAQAAKAESEMDTPEERAARLALIRAQIDAQGRSGRGDPATMARLLWEQGNYPEEEAEKKRRFEREMGWKQEDRRLSDEAAMARQQLSTSGSLFNTMTDFWAGVAPTAVMPGQTDFLGAGLAQNISGRIGVPFRQEDWRATGAQFDPYAAWRLAQQMPKGG